MKNLPSYKKPQMQSMVEPCLVMDPIFFLFLSVSRCRASAACLFLDAQWAALLLRHPHPGSLITGPLVIPKGHPPSVVNASCRLKDRNLAMCSGRC